MDRELTEMQQVAHACSGARLRRCSPPEGQTENDALLLLGLALVLLTDRADADLISVAALLYILL